MLNRKQLESFAGSIMLRNMKSNPLEIALRITRIALERKARLQETESAFWTRTKEASNTGEYVFIFQGENGQAVIACTLGQGYEYSKFFDAWQTVVVKRRGSGNRTAYARIRGE
jgi:hypothetical protein